MAVVYLARDKKHDRPVAIKILHPEIVAGIGADRFLLEIRILARLQHPHILALLDSGATDEAPPRPYYVMPYVDGETLRHRLDREGPLPFTGPSMAAVLSRQVLDPVPSLTTFRPGVPASLRRAIDPALAKVPAERYGSVLEFLTALEAPDAPAAEPKRSIVVLPFANLSPDPDNAYFADGLLEEVIADLSRVRALTVISRTSAVKLKAKDWDLRRIGRELNVRYALEGSVRRAGSALRITAQLIDVETDAHLWAEKYSGTVDDVFDLQERLSRQIVEALRITLSPPEDRELAQRPIADIRAFEYYQRARQEYYRHTAEGMVAARALAEHGLAVVGPHEALFGMLGTVYAWSPISGGGDEVTTLREAEACARRAFALNPDSAQGLSIMGQVAYRRGRAAEAVRLLSRACAAEPNNPDAMHQLAGAYLLGGRIGPVRELLTRLVELDPLTASNHCLLGMSYLLGGDALLALPVHQRAVELDPRSTICRVCAAIPDRKSTRLNSSH